jgi:hypothetical protein
MLNTQRASCAGLTRASKDHHSSLGGEHGERIALVNDGFATAFGGDPKDPH